jgi:hypothetical protein
LWLAPAQAGAHQHVVKMFAPRLQRHLVPGHAPYERRRRHRPYAACRRRLPAVRLRVRAGFRGRGGVALDGHSRPTQSPRTAIAGHGLHGHDRDPRK